MSSNNFVIIGPGARLASHLGLSTTAASYSLRPGPNGLPAQLTGTIVIFADPPSISATRAAFHDLLSRIALDADARLILISSISAGFRDSAIFPVDGAYSQRKRLAEDMLLSRADLQSTIFRVGNVREYGGWHAVFAHCRLAVLPSQCRQVALADLDALRCAVLAAPAAATTAIINSYVLRDTETCFKSVIHVPGLLRLYQFVPTRFIMRVLAKVARRFSVYIPSPDDLNAFLLKGH